ncbi:MAG: UbiD family decarboxylase [Rhodospirillaceae bacterium]|nr:UbiD family decarboxylase [Rhodospirillaceae bacterium]
MPDTAPARKNQLDKDLRGWLSANRDIVTVIRKPVAMDDVSALIAQSHKPILFENIKEFPGFRLCDMLVRHRWSQCRALGVGPAEFLPTLAQRLRKAPRGLVAVDTGPVKEVVKTGKDVDWTKLPIPIHTEREPDRYITAMNIIRDPETGFYNSCHAGTTPTGPDRGLVSFVTSHSHQIMRKYLAMGKKEMPIAFVFGVPPAYEIVANFSGLHLDLWGEMDMVGTVMDMDVEMVPCETIDLTVPAHAEIVVEGILDLSSLHDFGFSVSPSMYYMPEKQRLPEVRVTAITMRGDRPIYRNHLTVPDTDHQVLPRLCHEAVLYNRVSEIGLKVHDVRFPTWGAALSVIVQVDYSRPGLVNDALMTCMGAPWLNTKMCVAVSPDTDIDDPAQVYHAMATRVDPARDVFVVPYTRGSIFDPAGEPLDGHYPHRLVGKIGIDATAKAHRGGAIFDRAWPKNWGKVKLEDYLD